MRSWLTICLFIVAVWPASAAAGKAAERRAAELPAGLAYLRDVDATIVQAIRYAGADNFSGAKVPGYDAGECILTKKAAEALRRVQDALRSRNLSLKVYDCYRPRRSVKAFVDWAKRPEPDSAKSKRFHPNIGRGKLIALGYIAAVSGHSRADTVDLTLTPTPAADSAGVRSADGGDNCTTPDAALKSDGSLDMGTTFDCFDAKSNTSSPSISQSQRENRRALVSAMEREGYRNYSREWWHFTFGDGRGADYDFPIAPR